MQQPSDIDVCVFLQDGARTSPSASPPSSQELPNSRRGLPRSSLQQAPVPMQCTSTAAQQCAPTSLSAIDTDNPQSPADVSPVQSTAAQQSHLIPSGASSPQLAASDHDNGPQFHEVGVAADGQPAEPSTRTDPVLRNASETTLANVEDWGMTEPLRGHPFSSGAAIQRPPRAAAGPLILATSALSAKLVVELSQLCLQLGGAQLQTSVMPTTTHLVVKVHSFRYAYRVQLSIALMMMTQHTIVLKTQKTSPSRIPQACNLRLCGVAALSNDMWSMPS